MAKSRQLDAGSLGLWLAFGSLLFVPVTGKDLGPCKYQNSRTLECENCGTEGVRVAAPVTHLRLINVTGTAPDYRHVDHLEWLGSRLTRIEQVAGKVQQLRTLDIRYNEIGNLRHSEFKNFSSLQVMNLGFNHIDDLPRNVFTNLNLQRLCLSHNLLQAIPFQVFAPMPNLMELDLSYNLILTILDHFFKPNKNIEVLLLNNNRIAKLTSNALADLRELRRLDLSNNSLAYIAKGVFDALHRLQYLNLANNPLQSLARETFRGLISLSEINISGNHIQTLTYGLFLFSPSITTLTLDDTNIEVLHNTDLFGLGNLKTLQIRHNQQLREIEGFFFADTPRIARLELNGNSLAFLPHSLKSLRDLEFLNIADNLWACDCRMSWFAPWVNRHKENLTLSDLSCSHAYPNDMLPTLNHLNCTAPHIVYATPTRQYRLKSSALLECKYAGNPLPSITWVTPKREVYHWNPDAMVADVFYKHPQVHDEYLNRIGSRRIQVLDNGTLLVQNITREDCGRYTCFATNPIANVTGKVLLHIDPADWNYVKIVSIIIGVQFAVGFLILTLLVQFLRYVLDK